VEKLPASVVVAAKASKGAVVVDVLKDRCVVTLHRNVILLELAAGAAKEYVAAAVAEVLTNYNDVPSVIFFIHTLSGLLLLIFQNPKSPIAIPMGST
jgi:uncharacterized membrane protein